MRFLLASPFLFVGTALVTIGLYIGLGKVEADRVGQRMFALLDRIGQERRNLGEVQ